MEQHIAFAEAYKVLQDHMEESVITEESYETGLLTMGKSISKLSRLDKRSKH